MNVQYLFLIKNNVHYSFFFLNYSIMRRGIISICVPPINILYATLYEHILYCSVVVFPFVTNNIINTLNLRDGDFNGLAKTHALTTAPAAAEIVCSFYYYYFFFEIWLDYISEQYLQSVYSAIQ